MELNLKPIHISMNKPTLEQSLRGKYLEKMPTIATLAGYAVVSRLDNETAHIAVFNEYRDAGMYSNKLEANGTEVSHIILLKEITATEIIVEKTKTRLSVKNVIVENA